MLCEARGQESYILVTVVVVFVVVVATILSAICVVTNTSLPQYVRVILLSYCLANATGRYMQMCSYAEFLSLFVCL